MSLVRNINRRKKLGISRSKKKSTISAKAYKDMKNKWKKKQWVAKKKNNLLSKEEHESRSRFKKTSISTNKSRIKWSSMNKSKRRQHKK